MKICLFNAKGGVGRTTLALKGLPEDTRGVGGVPEARRRHTRSRARS